MSESLTWIKIWGKEAGVEKDTMKKPSSKNHRAKEKEGDLQIQKRVWIRDEEDMGTTAGNSSACYELVEDLCFTEG